MTLSMPHSSLITDICQHAEVTWEENEEMLKTRIPTEFFSRKPVNRMRASREQGPEAASGSGKSLPELPGP